MFKLWKKKNIFVRDFVMIAFIPVLRWGLDYETELSTAHLGIQDRDLAYERK
jgi:hypothetical protein